MILSASATSRIIPCTPIKLPRSGISWTVQVTCRLRCLSLLDMILGVPIQRIQLPTPHRAYRGKTSRAYRVPYGPLRASANIFLCLCAQTAQRRAPAQRQPLFPAPASSQTRCQYASRGARRTQPDWMSSAPFHSAARVQSATRSTSTHRPRSTGPPH